MQELCYSANIVNQQQKERVNAERYDARAELDALYADPNWEEETLLSAWLTRKALSYYAFADLLGTSPKSVGEWARGKVMPTLVFAFKIEQLTRGDVPAASWLGTTVGKHLWLRQKVVPAKTRQRQAYERLSPERKQQKREHINEWKRKRRRTEEGQGAAEAGGSGPEGGETDSAEPVPAGTPAP